MIGDHAALTVARSQAKPGLDATAYGAAGTLNSASAGGVTALSECAVPAGTHS